MVLGYRSSGITRRDVALWSDETLSNAQYQDVIKLIAEIDEAVLLGKSRSSYSPPVNKESVGYILAVRAANAERAERERELLSQTPALEQPTGLPESSDPAITRTDDLTR